MRDAWILCFSFKLDGYFSAQGVLLLPFILFHAKRCDVPPCPCFLEPIKSYFNVKDLRIFLLAFLFKIVVVNTLLRFVIYLF